MLLYDNSDVPFDTLQVIGFNQIADRRSLPILPFNLVDRRSRPVLLKQPLGCVPVVSALSRDSTSRAIPDESSPTPSLKPLNGVTSSVKVLEVRIGKSVPIYGLVFELV